ncbi:hypothetical protein H0E87_026758 [Populus deltoides]|uniref:Glycosyltransferase N-terminal domain-containing protein n=1 Tax=Populus deltoides TaxID=3696 RepID=A0A8T2WY61_POPDE|nr:hypothetical protein H0E87_026758 [Populus deltoides]
MAPPISSQLHFVLIPLMAQGHMIPMIDMARLISERGVTVSLVTTPHNASRFEAIIDRARESGLPIRLVQIRFPCEEVGLPIGLENLDTLPSRDLLKKFYVAVARLQQPLEHLLEHAKPPPSCIISDKCLSWTSKTAQRFNIPRIVFHGMCCFSLLSSHNIRLHKAHLSVTSDSEPFVVPGMPQSFEVTKAQLPGAFVSLPDLDDVRNKMQEAESTAYGVVVNSFDELEHGCAEEYTKALKKKVWCIGPVSLCNKNNLDKFERGNKASIDEKQCLEWLDSMKPGSVIYACLGSLCRLVPSQLIELGLGLEASKQPFIWVVKTGETGSELEEWIGVRVGVEVPVRWGEEEKVGVLVKKDEVKKAVITLMDAGGEGSKKRRKRAIELGKSANKAMELGGSSNLNLSFLIQDITKQLTQNKG